MASETFDGRARRTGTHPSGFAIVGLDIALSEALDKKDSALSEEPL